MAVDDEGVMQRTGKSLPLLPPDRRPAPALVAVLAAIFVALEGT